MGVRRLGSGGGQISGGLQWAIEAGLVGSQGLGRPGTQEPQLFWRRDHSDASATAIQFLAYDTQLPTALRTTSSSGRSTINGSVCGAPQCNNVKVDKRSEGKKKRTLQIPSGSLPAYVYSRV